MLVVLVRDHDEMTPELAAHNDIRLWQEPGHLFRKLRHLISFLEIERQVFQDDCSGESIVWCGRGKGLRVARGLRERREGEAHQSEVAGQAIDNEGTGHPDED